MPYDLELSGGPNRSATPAAARWVAPPAAIGLGSATAQTTVENPSTRASTQGGVVPKWLPRLERDDGGAADRQLAGAAQRDHLGGLPWVL